MSKGLNTQITLFDVSKIYKLINQAFDVKCIWHALPSKMGIDKKIQKKICWGGTENFDFREVLLWGDQFFQRGVREFLGKMEKQIVCVVNTKFAFVD